MRMEETGLWGIPSRLLVVVKGHEPNGRPGSSKSLFPHRNIKKQLETGSTNLIGILKKFKVYSNLGKLNKEKSTFKTIGKFGVFSLVLPQHLALA